MDERLKSPASGAGLRFESSNLSTIKEKKEKAVCRHYIFLLSMDYNAVIG